MGPKVAAVPWAKLHPVNRGYHHSFNVRHQGQNLVGMHPFLRCPVGGQDYLWLLRVWNVSKEPKFTFNLKSFKQAGQAHQSTRARSLTHLQSCVRHLLVYLELGCESESDTWSLSLKGLAGQGRKQRTDSTGYHAAECFGDKIRGDSQEVTGRKQGQRMLCVPGVQCSPRAL